MSCSLRKYAKQTATDPVTGEEVPLFNPRTHAWEQHFRWEGERVVALTATGRATASALAMNRPLILAIRQEESARVAIRPRDRKSTRLNSSHWITSRMPSSA